MKFEELAHYFCLKLRQIKQQESWFLVDFFDSNSYREQEKSCTLHLSEFSFFPQVKKQMHNSVSYKKTSLCGKV